MLPVSDAAEKEQAVIERRRRLEEERKKRIFNPKMRTMGVCVSSKLLQNGNIAFLGG